MKKLILTLMIVLTSSAAQARTPMDPRDFDHEPVRHEVREGVDTLVALEGRVDGVRTLCPRGAHCATNGVVVDLSFMYGCDSDFGPFAAKGVMNEDTLEIFVSAYEGASARRDRVRCAAFQQERRALDFPNLFPRRIRVHYLGTDRVSHFDPAARRSFR